MVGSTTHRRATRLGFYSTSALLASATFASAGTVFTDNFSTSTTQTNATAVTATQTNYNVGSNKAVAPLAISGGALQFGGNNSAVEAQAVFTSTPIVLTNIGDNVELVATFTSPALSAVSAQTMFGLYSSGGIKPYANLNTGSLSSSNTNDATGGAAGWTGYHIVFQNTGSSTSSKTYARPSQSGSTNVTQDLLVGPLSSSVGYAGATQLTGGSSSNAAAQFTNVPGSTFTEYFSITRSAAGVNTIVASIYAGSSATGTPISTLGGTDSAGVYNNIDALSLGYRINATGAIGELDYSQITVSSNTVGTPEPASCMLMSLVAVAGLVRRRR